MYQLWHIFVLSATKNRKQTRSKAYQQKYFNYMALQFQYALTFEEETDICGELLGTNQ